MDSESNIQPSFEIQRLLERFEKTKQAYFELIQEGSCQEVVEEENELMQ